MLIITLQSQHKISIKQNYSFSIRPSVPGSYRGTFKTERITYGQMDHEDQNANLSTTNMFMQPEYKGIVYIRYSHRVLCKLD